MDVLIKMTLKDKSNEKSFHKSNKNTHSHDNESPSKYLESLVCQMKD